MGVTMKLLGPAMCSSWFDLFEAYVQVVHNKWFCINVWFIKFIGPAKAGQARLAVMPMLLLRDLQA